MSQQQWNERAAAECDAHNAAFYELGLQWHWDSATYDRIAHVATGRERIAYYLAQYQPHLLKAYDVGFLVDAIHGRVSASKPPSNFNWASTSAGQLGA